MIGTTGFALQGSNLNDWSGSAVRNAGDVNGDGFDDLLIGAFNAYINVSETPTRTGASYVVFGKASGWSGMDLSTLSGSNGFRLNGMAAQDQTGFSVSGAGDLNGDGVADLVVGAKGGHVYGTDRSGSTYIVFGQSTGWNAAMSLYPTLPGESVRLDGAANYDQSGFSVSSEGDINGDGLDDLLISAVYSDQGGIDKGAIYVVFGKISWPSTVIELANLTGSDGFRLVGVDDDDAAGWSVSNDGDFNGDGYGDMLVTSWSADPNATANAGSAYLIYGKADWGGVAAIDLASLDGSTGFRLDGVSPDDHAGVSARFAGDLNGDGFDDLIIGAPLAEPDMMGNANWNSGESYVLFGGNFNNATRTDLTATGTVKVGGAGFDHLTGVAGGARDILIGGAGNDTLMILDGNIQRIDGGGGVDTLVLGSTGYTSAGGDIGYWTPGNGVSLDLGVAATRDAIHDIERIDMVGNNFAHLSLTKAGVEQITGPGATLHVTGDATNTVHIDNYWVDTGITVSGSDGQQYKKVTSDGVTLLLDADLNFAPAGTLSVTGNPYRGQTLTASMAGITDRDGMGLQSDYSFQWYANGVAISGATTTNATTSTLTLDNALAFGTAITVAFRYKDGVHAYKDSIIGHASDAVRGGPDTGDAALAIVGNALVGSVLTVNLGPDLDGGVLSETLVYTWKADGVEISGQTGTGTILPLTLTAAEAGAVISLEVSYTDGHGYAEHLISQTPVVTTPTPAVALGSLTGAQGIRLTNRTYNADEYAGRSVASVGDINGDGIGDVAIGVPFANSSDTASGYTYVMFGVAGGFGSNALEMACSLGSSSGFRIAGGYANDRLPRSIGHGDFNGDGVDDLLIGAPTVFAGNLQDAGKAYVIFGKDTSLAVNFGDGLSVDTLDGGNGFGINGTAANGSLGNAVASAGDVNGDGYDDLLIGQHAMDVMRGVNLESDVGGAYVVFGHGGTFAAELNIGALDGSTGFRIEGAVAGDQVGYAVASVGDMNGDGFADIALTTPSISGGEGRVYVVFGASGGFASSLDLASLGTTISGFLFKGVTGSQSGFSVSSAGDVNGDGYDDLLIGAPQADGSGSVGNHRGESYVIFGNSIGLTGVIEAGDLGSNGFALFGDRDYDQGGYSVSAGGDINGDGFADLLVGAPFGADYYDSVNQVQISDRGSTFVIFGKSSGFNAAMELCQLDGIEGFRLDGANANDQSGFAVASAGDVNKDGFEDFLIGAPNFYYNSQSNAGAAYLYYGGNFTGLASDSVTANGNTDANILSGGLGADYLHGWGGADVLLGGQGDDQFSVADDTFLKIDGGGGYDTLQLNGAASFELDLTKAGLANRIHGIEAINLKGSLAANDLGTLRGHSLWLNSQTIGQISDPSAGIDLIIEGDSTCTLHLESGFIRDAGLSTTTYEVYTDGAQSLKIGKTVHVQSWVQLGSLDGQNGYRLNGLAASDDTGTAVAVGGDFNGDGFGDLVIGAPNVRYVGETLTSGTGAAYVVFGSSIPVSSAPDLSALINSPTTGFQFTGELNADQWVGGAVSLSGDINGDGYADLVVGAPHIDGGKGGVYVVFGTSNPTWTTPANLATNDNMGFAIFGEAVNDALGYSLSFAGDVNGDGWDDLIVGARGAGGDNGAAYVIFGHGGSWGTELQLTALDGTNGFRLNGAAGDRAGFAVSSAGDVNGDGLADLLIGAPSNIVNAPGRTYVVFGQNGGWSAQLDLDNLGTHGFALTGNGSEVNTGWSVSSIGDVNGDGLDDLIVSAPWDNNANSVDSGIAYVVFGATNMTSLDLSTLNGTKGFRIDGQQSGDRVGYSVSGAGDVNGDGLDDLVIGATGVDHLATDAGRGYLLYGKTTWSSVVELDRIEVADGLTFEGAKADDGAGLWVSGGGDLNQDGFDDLLIASPALNNVNAPGAVDVFFGGNLNGAVITTVDGTGDRVLGSAGVDILRGNGGADVLLGGAGNDYLYASDTTFRRVDGGSGYDILTFEADPNYPSHGVVLDITESGMAGRIRGIEEIDMSNGRVDTLILGGPESILSIVSGADYNDTTYTTAITLSFTSDESDHLILKGSWTVQDMSDYFLYQNASAQIQLVTGPYISVSILPNDLATLTGDNGFALAWDSDGLPYTGYAVSSAGDFNGDGIADLLVGMPHLVDQQYGGAYVVFGTGNTPATITGSLSLAFDIGVGEGYLLWGESAHQRAGYSVNSIGDINGDGLDDIVIGTNNDGAGYSGPGSCYVVFGSSSLADASLNLLTLDGQNGFQLFGIYDGDQFGVSAKGAGDINGDGFDDMIVGALRYDSPDGQGGFLTSSGAAYVVYGHASNFWGDFPSGTVNDLINDINGPAAFLIRGVEKHDHAGVSVSSAGDINGDGYADLIIGADRVDSAPGNVTDDRFGAAYVVYGKAGGFGTVIDLSTLSGTSGFKLFGTAAYDYSGFSVASAGDVNGDGLDDMLVGAFKANSNGKTYSGAAFVVFGKTGLFDSQVDLSALTGANGFRISGLANGDYLGTSVASAGDFNGDGFDDIVIGAPGAPLAFPGSYSASGSAYIVYGKGSGFAAAVDLATLGGQDGFRVDGLPGGTQAFGFSVASAGDLNLDGYDDVIIGAPGQSPVGSGANEQSYVLHGGNFTGAAPVWTMGFKVEGEYAGDHSGRSVSMAGDVNGDGFADVIIGAVGNPASTSAGPGAAYIVFGGASNQPFTLDLTGPDLTGTDGVELDGVSNGDYTGVSVSGVGDVNGDGYDDMLIGALNAHDVTGAASGVSYLFFGRAASDFSASNGLFELNQLMTNGDGVRLEGVWNQDRTGCSVSGAGDLNGDGFDDFVIGADRYPTGDGAGAVYVVFGQAGWSTTDPVQLSGIGNTDHPPVITTIFGEISSLAGYSVHAAGDFNGDGYDDLIIGAINADGSYKGAAYVVYGNPTGLGASLDLGTLAVNQGFKLTGIDNGEQTGTSVSSAGDINGDGVADLLIGAKEADRGDSNTGSLYVVFGVRGGGVTGIDLAKLDGANGFRLDGDSYHDYLGSSVATAGDFNGDGFADLVIGMSAQDEVYIVYGKASGFASVLTLANLQGANGIRIDSPQGYDGFGGSVSGGDDINGDGFSDIIVGASWSSTPYGNYNGASYVIYGGNDKAGLAADRSMTGTASGDTLRGSLGDDTLIGNGGSDVLIGGAGNDMFIIGDATFYTVDGGGGTDTLLLDGAGMTLDLTTGGLANRIHGIEIIDLQAGVGGHVISLSAKQVSQLVDSGQVLKINGDASDTVHFEFDDNWTVNLDSANQNGFTYNVYTAHGVTVWVETTMTNTTVLDPLVLDLDGDGVELVDSLVYFDMVGQGNLQKTGWVAPDDGLLALDANHDGVINDATELFSERMFDDAHSGMAALSRFDDNLDHLLDAHDAAWSDLLVWRDANQDGVSQAGELGGLAHHGIASIVLEIHVNGAWQGENQVLTDALFTRSDGQTGGIHEVAFAVHPTDTLSLQEAIGALMPENVPALLLPEIAAGGYFEALEDVTPVVAATTQDLDLAIQAMITAPSDGPQPVADGSAPTDHASEVAVIQTPLVEDPLHPHTLVHVGG
ncbi:MAG: FG-GAP repeat protein [Magnetococcales bacterium]|nr:FG-GAP repeat protein [Magnetococcales bacterium]